MHTIFIVLLISFLLTILVGKKFIQFMIKWQGEGQPIRNDGPETHMLKIGTPTMGGLLIICIILICSAIFTISTIILPLLFITVAYGSIGFIDDYAKIKKQNTKGLKAKTRLLLELIIAAIVIWYIDPITIIRIPFIDRILDLGLLYYFFAIIVVVGSANATNLTDGLDGLLSGTAIIALSTFVLIILMILYNIYPITKLDVTLDQNDLYDLIALYSIVIGVLLGFLWYNASPARIFMGDVGSLAIGGLIGITAIILKQEILLIIIGGIFVIEALSVIIQVISYKIRKKRIFLMAPIHHHFEKLNIPENTIVIRFWIISLLLSYLSLWSIFLIE